MNIPALIALWNCTQRHPDTSGGRACAAVLLGLYNGERFPMDLTDLRSLDLALTPAALAVISADAQHCQMEVHQWLNQITGRTDFGWRFEHLAFEQRARKRCKKEELVPISPPRLVITQAQPTQPMQAAA